MIKSELSAVKFPSKYDKDEGSKKWIQRGIKACWDDWNAIKCNSFYSGRRRYATIDSYMLGNQSIEQYRKRLKIDIANQDDSYLNIDRKVLKIVPKFRRMTISSLENNEYGIKISPIDPLSRDESDKYYADQAAKIKMREMLRANGLPENLVESPEERIESEEDLDLFMKYGYKSRMAVEADNALRLVMSNNKFDNIREEALSNLHDYGFIGYEEYFDPNGDIKIRRVAPENFLVSRCKEPDFSDAMWVGQILDTTLYELKELDIDGELEDKDFKEIYEQLNRSSDGIEPSQNPEELENQRCQVLSVQFKSYKDYTIQSSVNKDGNKRVSRARKIRKSRQEEYKSAEYTVIYEGKWIVGTDKYFGCKLQTNMKRSKNNLADTSFTIHAYAPNLNNMETWSMGEQYIPIADQIQLAWYKYQEVVISAKKKGVAIEIGGLENVPLGKNGKRMEPREVMDLYHKEGILVWRRMDENGKINQYKPIEELANGLGGEAQEYFLQIQNAINLMREVSGYNELTDGSTPDPRTLSGVAKFASESTNKSLDFLKKADRRVITSLANGLILRIQDSAKEGKLDGYIKAIGKDSIEYFKVNPDISMRELGIVVEESPNEFDRQRLTEMVNLSIQNKDITIADALLIENMESVPYAEALLSLRIRKNQEAQQELARMNQQENAKIQQESLMMSAQVKEREIQMKSQSKIAEINAEKEWDMKILQMKIEGDKVVKMLDNQGVVDANKEISASRRYVADRTAKSKKEEKEMEVENEPEVEVENE